MLLCGRIIIQGDKNCGGSMARPPSGTDIRLKKAGKELLQEKGLAGFSVREACRQAGVNTGMFRYYFGSKEEFLQTLLKEIYADFLEHFNAAAAAGTPRERLKSALVELGRFALGMRRVAPLIFADLSYGRKEAFAFARDNFTAHIGQLGLLAAECAPASALKGHSMPFLIAALAPVMIFPVLMASLLERNGVKAVGPFRLEALREELFSEDGLDERAEIALRGIGL